MNRRIVLAFDISPTVGFGHIGRMVALAEALSPDWEVWLASPPHLEVEALLRRRSWRWLNRSSLLRGLSTLKPAWLIFDEPRTEEPVMEFRAVSPRTRIGVTEYWSQRASRVDLAIMPFEPFPDAPPVCADRILEGLRYLLVRPEVAKRGRRITQLRTVIEKVTISFGGVDHQRRAPKVLRAVLETHPGWHVKVALGRLVPNPVADDVRAIAKQAPSVQVEVMPHDFISWLEDSDLVICSGGATLAEAVLLRVPTISWPTTPAEQRFAALFHHAGAAIVVEDESQVREAIGSVQRYERRRQLRQASERVLDGDGADRVAAVLRACELS